MAFHEVPETQWHSFCKKFTEQHHGQRLRIERVVDSDAVPWFRGQVELDRLELTKTPARVVVVLTDDRRFELEVPQPSRITLAQADESRSGQVRIDSRVDAGVILHFGEGPARDTS